jgi:hypothetical protein
MGVSGQLHAPAALLHPGKDPRYPLDRRMRGPQSPRSRFDPWQRLRDFSSNFCVQTGSGANPASCTMGTGVLYPGVKRGRGVTLTTDPIQCRGRECVRGIHPPPCASLGEFWDCSTQQSSRPKSRSRQIMLLLLIKSRL